MRVFEIPLPEEGYQEPVLKAQAAGLPFTQEQADTVVAEAKKYPDSIPVLTYYVEFPPARELRAIHQRLKACIKLKGVGQVPAFDKLALAEMSALLVDCGLALNELLR